MDASQNFMRSLVLMTLLGVAAGSGAVPNGPVVGSAQVLLGDVTAVDQDGDAFEMKRSGDVYAGITVTTGSRSFVKIVMLDGTSFSLGEEGEATISSFSYDPDARTGGFTASIDAGASVYASGEIGKFSTTREHSTITTPHAVIGIRGSVVNVFVSQFTVVENAQGVITLTSRTTGNVIVLDVGEAAQLSAESDGKIDISGLTDDVKTRLEEAILLDKDTGPDSVDVTTITETDSTIVASPITP